MNILKKKQFENGKGSGRSLEKSKGKYQSTGDFAQLLGGGVTLQRSPVKCQRLRQQTFMTWNKLEKVYMNNKQLCGILVLV